MTICRASWSDALTDYRTWMTAARLSPQTIYLRSYQLRRLAESFPTSPWTITTEDLVSWLANPRWAAGTVRSWRSMLGSFYHWAVITGRVASSPTANLPRAPKVQLKPRPAPELVIDEAIRSADRRTGLMIRLGRSCGLRRGEIAQVHTDDLVQDGDGWGLIVHGKGGKERWVPVDQATVDHLKLWMDGRQGWVFPGQKSGHLAPATVGKLVSNHLTGRWTTHTLRHRFATRVYDGCHDLRATQELLGHAKADTTQIYVEVNRESLRRAANYAA